MRCYGEKKKEERKPMVKYHFNVVFSQATTAATAAAFNSSYEPPSASVCLSVVQNSTSRFVPHCWLFFRHHYHIHFIRHINCPNACSITFHLTRSRSSIHSYLLFLLDFFLLLCFFSLFHISPAHIVAHNYSANNDAVRPQHGVFYWNIAYNYCGHDLKQNKNERREIMRHN